MQQNYSKKNRTPLTTWLFILLCYPLSVSAATHTGPISPPTSGYGSWGTKAVASPIVFSFDTQGHDNSITIYHPEGIAAPAASIFFAPGWNIGCDDYREFLRFLASKGYTTVCDDYFENPGIIGGQLKASFREAANRYPTLIDTSRIGVAGHSSGAGLLPSVTYDLVRNAHWGNRGAFMFSSAPWIDFDISDAMLADFPTTIKFVLQTYEDDLETDIRTYVQQFEQLPIPDTEKEYVTLRPAVIDGYSYEADHAVLATGDNGYGVFDALDDYGVFRIVEALADYTFTGNPEGKRVALGDGAEEQLDMGELRDLVSTDDPRPIPGITHHFPCDIPDNPRRTHCADFDEELPASVLHQPVKHLITGDTSPLFIWEPVVTAENYVLQLRPLLPDGEPDWSTSYGVTNITATQAGCENLTDLCQLELPGDLPQAGNYVWWIRAASAQRQGVWSRRGYFSTEGLTLFADGFE